MSKLGLIERIGGGVSTLALHLDQNALSIGFWGGLGLILGGAGLAVYQAVTKVPEIKETHKQLNNKIESEAEQGFITAEKKEEEIKRGNRGAVKSYVKAFAFPGGMMIVGTALEIAVHVKGNQRFAEVSSLLASQTLFINSYRKRTAALIGEEQEKALYYGKDLVAVTKEKKDEDGNVIGTETEYYLEDKEGSEKVPLDPYTFEFSPDTTDMCRENDDMVEFNESQLKIVENDWNNILHKQGIVFLDSVLAALGLSLDENFASRRAGWLDRDYYDTPGDGYIDFRATKVRYTRANRQQAWKWMLNFNCDGDVLEMGTRQKGLMGKTNELAGVWV